MNDSKLRLQIITALDNAGLKATQDQINKLEKQLKNVNEKPNVSGITKELTKIPGKIGAISSSLGGLAIGLGVVYAGIKTFIGGVTVGKKAFETFGNGAGYTLDSIAGGFSNISTKIKNAIQEFFTGTNDMKAIAAAHEVAMSNIDAQT